MCIICIKPANHDMPAPATRRAMWENNPDGAGIMYTYRGNVFIDKGFMSFVDMENHITHLGTLIDLTRTPMILHYRIATHGGVNPQCTHPFPCSANPRVLRATHAITHLGIAHNGIIPITPRRGFSDTMEYIADVLAQLPKPFYKDAKILEFITRDVGSCRLAMMDGSGHIAKVGNWITSDGLLFSNSSFHPRGLEATWLRRLLLEA